MLFASLIATDLFASAASAVQAEAASGRHLVTIGAGEPAGFFNLVAPHRIVVDFYFGDKRLGDAQVTFLPGSLTFIEPGKLIAILQDLVDAPAVRCGGLRRQSVSRARLTSISIGYLAELFVPPSLEHPSEHQQRAHRRQVARGSGSASQPNSAPSGSRLVAVSSASERRCARRPTSSNAIKPLCTDRRTLIQFAERSAYRCPCNKT